MTSIIVPTILVPTFEEFKMQIQKLSPVFKLIQIDVMDGIFVDNKSFDEIEKINEIDNLPELELHLMVENPIAEIEKWRDIKNIKKIIFHIESKDNPNETISTITGICSKAGIALKPETPLSAIEPYLERINEVLFLAVNPGHQGNPFQPEVGEKVKELTRRSVRPIIAVDGGINENNIAEIQSWGVEIFCIGSALTQADDVESAYKSLNSKLC